MEMDGITGTPLDYSDNRVGVYFEVADLESTREIIDSLSFLGQIEYRKHGFNVRIAVQQIPEVVLQLTKSNIAIYAVIPER